MANYTPAYTISKIAMRFGGVTRPFLQVNINIPNLQSGDTISFGTNFSTQVNAIGEVLTCGIYEHDVTPLNKWGFHNGAILQDDDNQRVSLTTNVVSLGATYDSIFTDMYVKISGTWRFLNIGGEETGGFHQDDNYYTSPVMLVFNIATEKYIYMAAPGRGALYYDSIDPGIVNTGNVCTSLISGYPHDYDVPPSGLTVLGETELVGITILSTDPYDLGGTSGTGGGTGTFDGTGDNIGIPSLPTLSAVDTGFITIFNPSIAQLQSLASYMWSNPLFDLDAWKKIVADPMHAILGLSIVPVDVPAGGARAVTVGNISTGVTMTTAASQYVEVDCGTLNVKEYWGAYLDYDPYTKAEIYLPYCGTHPIAVDDIMEKSVHVVYHVDILSGACCAYVQCGGSVLYTFIGQCSSSIPITGDDWTNVINGVISAAVSVGTMIATEGATAPMAVTSLASTATNNLKPSIEKSGAMGGTGGMLAVQTPYLILTRPRQALPAYQNQFMGYPSLITENLDTITGYTEVESLHLENIPATDSEIVEIESLLKSGVIF